MKTDRRDIAFQGSLGLTVIEVLIALVVMAIALTALAMTQITTMRVNADSRRASDATEYANSLFEEKTQEIIRNFAATLSNCDVGTPCSEDLDSGYEGTFTWGKAGNDYLTEGLVVMTISMTEPSQISFSRTVSCIDVYPAPSVALPAPCPFGTPEP